MGLKQLMNRSKGYPRNYSPEQNIVINDNPGNYKESIFKSKSRQDQIRDKFKEVDLAWKNNVEEK